MWCPWNWRAKNKTVKTNKEELNKKLKSVKCKVVTGS
jgi:hypothetical protein